MIKNKVLRQLRSDMGWTQGQAAREIGIQQSYLSKLENDRALPSHEILKKISFTYNCQISDIAFIDKSKANNKQSLGRFFYAGLVLALAGFLSLALAYLGIIHNNTAYTYQLAHSQTSTAQYGVTVPNFIVTDEFMGEKYLESSKGTEAAYVLLGERSISPLANRILYFLGVFLVLMGLALQTVRLVNYRNKS